VNRWWKPRNSETGSNLVDIGPVCSARGGGECVAVLDFEAV
jgi:hypothetical protein